MSKLNSIGAVGKDERLKPESSGCVRMACEVSNNKPKGVINARYNILQAQKCISRCVLSSPLILLCYQIFYYFDSHGDADYVSSRRTVMAKTGGGPGGTVEEKAQFQH